REPLRQQAVLEEIERPAFLLGAVRGSREVRDLDLDGALLDELLEPGLDRRLDEIHLRAEPGAELVEHALQVGRDLHVERRSNAGELEVVDHAYGSRALLEG